MTISILGLFSKLFLGYLFQGNFHSARIAVLLSGLFSGEFEDYFQHHFQDYVFSAPFEDYVLGVTLRTTFKAIFKTT